MRLCGAGCRRTVLTYNAVSFLFARLSFVNPDLARLQPYPFEKLRQLCSGVSPAPSNSGLKTFREIRLSIGEPQHATPTLIQRALADSLDTLAVYPTTQGSEALRHAIAAWASRRYALPALDANTQVLPVNGTREALFAFAQTVVRKWSALIRSIRFMKALPCSPARNRFF